MTGLKKLINEIKTKFLTWDDLLRTEVPKIEKLTAHLLNHKQESPIHQIGCFNRKPRNKTEPYIWLITDDPLFILQSSTAKPWVSCHSLGWHDTRLGDYFMTPILLSQIPKMKICYILNIALKPLGRFYVYHPEEKTAIAFGFYKSPNASPIVNEALAETILHALTGESVTTEDTPYLPEPSNAFYFDRPFVWTKPANGREFRFNKTRIYNPIENRVMIAEDVPKYQYCQSCDELYPEYDLLYLPEYDEVVCQCCFNNNYVTCLHCGETYLRDDCTYVTRVIQSGILLYDEYICLNCMEEFYTCNNCDAWVHHSDAIYHEEEDTYYCFDCHEEREDEE